MHCIYLCIATLHVYITYIMIMTNKRKIENIFHVYKADVFEYWNAKKIIKSIFFHKFNSSSSFILTKYVYFYGYFDVGFVWSRLIKFCFIWNVNSNNMFIYISDYWSYYKSWITISYFLLKYWPIFFLIIMMKWFIQKCTLFCFVFLLITYIWYNINNNLFIWKI